MFEMSNLCADSQKFVGYLAYGDSTRAMLTSIAIGKTLANTVALPSAPVEDIEQFYKTTALISLQSKLSRLNELVVIDTAAALDYVRRFYITRYYAAFPKKTVFCLNSETAIECFLGAANALDPVTVEAIKAAPIEITKLHNSLTQLFDELGE